MEKTDKQVKFVTKDHLAEFIWAIRFSSFIALFKWL
jgi:hypothetical protein